MRKVALLPCLVALALSGCAATGSPPLATPQPTPKPVVLAQADPHLDGVVGRLLAVQTLLNQVDALVASAYSAQSIQLPETARASFTDAGRQLGGTARIFPTLGSPGRYARAADLLRRSLQLYQSSAKQGMVNWARSHQDTSQAQSLLQEAGSMLAVSPEVGAPATTAAEQAALALALATAAASAPRSRHRSARPKPRVATPYPTPAARYHVAGVAVRSVPTTPRPTTPATSTPFPTPSPLPTSTPAPTATSRPVATDTRSHRSSLIQIVRRMAPVIVQGTGELQKAIAQITTCRRYLIRLSVGDDPLGSTKILGCIHRATRDLTHLSRRLGTIGKHTILRQERKAIRGAILELKVASRAVRAARVEDAKVELRRATKRVATAQSVMSRIETALRPH